MVVSPEPTGGDVLHLLDRVEQGSCKPGVTHGPVVAFDIGVLLWLTRLDMLDPDALLLSPGQQRATDVFRPLSQWIPVACHATR